MRIVFLLFLLWILAACTPQTLPVTPSPTQPPQISPTAVLEPTNPTPTDLPDAPALTPTSEPAPTKTTRSLPDLSGVSLYEAAHMMDPRFFQIALEGWPGDLPEGISVWVDEKAYECDVFFPDDFPDRLYCWGPAPPKFAEVLVQVTLEGTADPLLEIPFTVPAPGGG